MNFRSLFAYGIALGSCAFHASVAEAEENLVADVDITEGGVYEFQSASGQYGLLRNKVADESVVLKQTDELSDAEHAVKFTGFDAVGSAETRFLGGWWDFGATSADQINFFANNASVSSRMTVFDGAVVTNVGFAYLAGSSGTDNTMVLTNSSDVTVGNLSFGSKMQDANGKLVVTGGSSLTCRDKASMGDYNVNGTSQLNVYKYKTGNIWEVSGTNTTLSVGGTTYIGVPWNMSSYAGTTGGNTFSVTDGACADLGDLKVCTGGRHGASNVVVFARGAKVTMRSFSYDNNGYTRNDGRFGANRVSILDGAVVTNTGTFAFGTDHVESSQDELMISNATFHTDSYQSYGSGKILLRGYQSRFVMSGPKARFTMATPYTIPFVGPGCSYIVENCATNVWYGSSYGSFSYTYPTYNETVVVRNGARLECPLGIRTTGSSDGGASTNNKIVVEHDATLKAQQYSIEITGRGSELKVDDGTVESATNLEIGGSNCLMRVCGTRPRVMVPWSLNVRQYSALRFELPATGYEGATTDNPLIRVGDSSGGNGVFFADNCRLELTGASELLNYHKEQKTSREYVLIKANTGGINLPDGTLEALQAKMPKGVTIFIREGWHTYYLVLSVEPPKGLIVVFK